MTAELAHALQIALSGRGEAGPREMDGGEIAFTLREALRVHASLPRPGRLQLCAIAGRPPWPEDDDDTEDADFEPLLFAAPFGQRMTLHVDDASGLAVLTLEADWDGTPHTLACLLGHFEGEWDTWRLILGAPDAP